MAMGAIGALTLRRRTMSLRLQSHACGHRRSARRRRAGPARWALEACEGAPKNWPVRTPL